MCIILTIAYSIWLNRQENKQMKYNYILNLHLYYKGLTYKWRNTLNIIVYAAGTTPQMICLFYHKHNITIYSLFKQTLWTLFHNGTILIMTNVFIHMKQKII